MYFVTIDVARRLEDAQLWRSIHYVRAQARLRPEAGSAIEPIGGGYALFAGLGSPVNTVRGLGMHGPASPADIEQAEAFFRDRAETPRIDVCPLADASLSTLLARRGYILSHFMNVLARPLDDTVLAYIPPREIAITEATLDQLDLWMHVTAQGFTGRDDPPADVFTVLGPNTYSEAGVRFLAWIDGQPAGGGGMYLHDGVAEMGGASTRPAFRRRGVQTALLYMRLAVARRLGCDLAVVGTSPGSDSQRNIERAGFQLAYTKDIVIGA
jgi:GNAT superfamily N-acetyltransferase